MKALMGYIRGLEGPVGAARGDDLQQNAETVNGERTTYGRTLQLLEIIKIGANSVIY